MQTTHFVVFQLANFFLFFFSGKYLIVDNLTTKEHRSNIIKECDVGHLIMSGLVSCWKNIEQWCQKFVIQYTIACISPHLSNWFYGKKEEIGDLTLH